MNLQSTFQMNNGNRIPVVAMGSWDSRGDEGYQACLDALEAGYRSGNVQAIISALPAEKRGEAMAAVGDPKKVEAAKKMAQSGNLGSLFGKGK